MTVPDIPLQPIPQVQIRDTAPLEAFGGGAGLEAEGQMVQKIAASGGEIATFEKIRADQTAAEEAKAQLAAAHTKILYDPETGVLSSKGKNSIEAQTKGWAEFRQTANAISSKLNGQEQVGAFNRYATAMGDTFNQQTMAHVDKELTLHDAKTYDSLVTNQTQSAALAYGNPHARELALNTIDGATENYAKRNGWGQDELDAQKLKVNTNFHETVLSQMINDPNFRGQAKAYFDEYKSSMDAQSRDRVEQLFDTVPKQQEAAAKAERQEAYKANMRTAMLDMFDGKLTLSEAQRRFRNDQLDKSDYDLLEGKLSKPDAAVMKSFLVSDPPTFNEIRQAQLTGSASPGEIQRMIAEGAADKKITPDDGKYLLGINSDKPPTPRDKYIEAQANNIREFGNRYFTEKNILGLQTDKEKTSKEADDIVNEFYTAVDRSKATGDTIDEIRDKVKKMAMQKRFPGLGNLDKAPDVVIDVKGKVTHLLNPDQKSGLKPKYRIVQASESSEEDQ